LKGGAPVTMTSEQTALVRPSSRPVRPNFSCGPCAKPPGWTTAALSSAFVGRSHRSEEGRARLKLLIDQTRALLRLPDDYLLAIVPGSDTGAFELVLWNLLGARGVDVLAWDSFGKLWVSDIVDHLKLKDARRIEAEYGLLPDLSTVNFKSDVVLCANGTTSGVRIPNYDWIPDTRQGLTLVDATSAVFAQPVDWPKVDALTFSWQKVLGGEAAHGMLVLSPRAIKRLASYTPSWPLPKLFRITKNGQIDRALFDGQVINTPSMLCVEDCLMALSWSQSIGGLDGMMARSNHNARIVHDWIERTPWIDNLARDPNTWSNTSICLHLTDPKFLALSTQGRTRFCRQMVKRLEQEAVAFDVGSYRSAPPGLRIWTGATVEATDIEALLPWIEWAFAAECAGLA
jgi:phosphoserine aminotransferase